MLSRKKILWSMIALLAAVALVVGGTAVGQAVVSQDELAIETDALDAPAPPGAEEPAADAGDEPADAPADRSSRRRRPRSTAEVGEPAVETPADTAGKPNALRRAAAPEPAALEPGQPAVRQGVPARQPNRSAAEGPATVAPPVRPPAPFGRGPRSTSPAHPSSKGYRPGTQSGTYVYAPYGTAGPVQPGLPPQYSSTYPSTGRPNTSYGYTRYAYSGYKPDPALVKLMEADSKMESEAKDLAGQVRQATDDQKRAELRDKLEELCKEHFEVRQKRRQFEVMQLEKRLESIRTAIEKRSQAQELIIRRRVAQLLGEEDELAF